MRGYESIIEARMNQSKITDVWVFVLETNAPVGDYRHYLDPDNCLGYGFYPEVEIYADDNVLKLDLRCLTGLTVHLSGRDEHRVAQVLKRVNEFKPAVVFAMLGKILTTTADAVAV